MIAVLLHEVIIRIYVSSVYEEKVTGVKRKFLGNN